MGIILKISSQVQFIGCINWWNRKVLRTMQHSRSHIRWRKMILFPICSMSYSTFWSIYRSNDNSLKLFNPKPRMFVAPTNIRFPSLCSSPLGSQINHCPPLTKKIKSKNRKTTKKLVSGGQKNQDEVCVKIENVTCQ